MWVRDPPGLLIMIRFKYNGQVYAPSNLEKKLKKMGITIDDIEILPEEDAKKKVELIPFSNEYFEFYKWRFKGVKDEKGKYLEMVRPTDKIDGENIFNTHEEYEQWYRNNN